MTRRVAAIDCGTNSLRLLVADVDVDTGTLADVDRRMRIVRLGQGVDETGRLAPDALDRTTTALRDYTHLIAGHGAEAVRMVATSATRDADNAAEFVGRVTDLLGAAPEVLTGEEEARLSFTGATVELAATAACPPPHLVVDVGGGSTEFVLGGPGGVTAARSVDIGCVRMTERHLRSDPPEAAQVAAATADIDAAIDAAASDVPGSRARTLVGLAGSVATVAGIALDLPGYDAARIHHARIPAGRVHEVTLRLLTQTHAQRSTIGVMHPGRVDVIGGGAIVVEELARELHARAGITELVASEHDILDGIALSLG